MQLILDGQIQARIDSHNKVLFVSVLCCLHWSVLICQLYIQ
jgi:hypothetical protein